MAVELAGKPLALMVDLSSNNPLPNLKLHYDAGYRLLCLKVTEGTNYAWSASHSLAALWHSYGVDAWLWHYHFLHPGSVASGAQQADWFWAHVRTDIVAGRDRVVCDAETQGETGTELDAFWARYMTHDPHTPRVDYGGPYFFRDNGLRPHHDEDLWIAEYGSRVSFIPPGWTTWLAWQFTQSATGVPGMSGQVDQSHLAPSALPQPPTPPKPPTPKPQEHKMYIFRDTRKTPHPAWLVGDDAERTWLQDGPQEQFWIGLGIPVKDLSAYECHEVLDRMPIKAGTPVPRS